MLNRRIPQAYTPIWGYNTQAAYDANEHRKAKKQRNRQAARKRWNKGRITKPKPGVRPLSLFYPTHPARLYGWDDDRCIQRDRRVWV